MIAYLKGILAAIYSPYSIIVDVQGVGYTILVPPSLFGQLPAIGEAVQIYTSLVVREDSQTLYGFTTSQERELFEALIGTTGVGPKLALSLLGHLNLTELIGAVTQANLTLLCRVPGVGKKTAERLVLELKSKLPNLLPTTELVTHKAISPQLKQIQDAGQALVNLGYTQSTAVKAVRQAAEELDAECDLATLIMRALKHV